MTREKRDARLAARFERSGTPHDGCLLWRLGVGRVRRADVEMYSFVIPTVIALWGLSHGEAGLIGTVTLLISSFGGWFSGTLADRFGRVPMLQIRFLWPTDSKPA